MAECAKPGCDREVSHGVFACRLHWYELPAQMRGDLRRVWALRQTGTRGASAEHRSVMAAAMDYWQDE